MKDSVLEASFAVTVGEEGKAFSLQVDLQLDSGVLVLFGPSGAGKTLCLSVLSGRVQPQEGVVRLGERLLSDSSEGVFVPPHLRRIGYVPQHHSLFPFASVVENVAFGLPRAERRADSPRVRDLLDQLGIAHLAEARPETLSGGERQRVALARALAVQPELLLLDEPLASLDVEGRAELRRVLADFLQSTSCPAVYVTHNVPEALDLGDKVLRMSRGRTENAGLPSEVLAAESVRVQGQVERVDRGSDFTAVHLREAVVTGPNSALAAEDDGRFRLNLRLDRD